MYRHRTEQLNSLLVDQDQARYLEKLPLAKDGVALNCFKFLSLLSKSLTFMLFIRLFERRTGSALFFADSSSPGWRPLTTQLPIKKQIPSIHQQKGVSPSDSVN